MVRGGPAPPWSRNDRRCRWRMPPSCPRAPCRTGTASGSATSTPRSPSERAGGCATEWRCGPGAALPPRGTAPRPPVEPRSAALPLPAPPPSSQHPFPFPSWAALRARSPSGSALSPARGAGARLSLGVLHLRAGGPGAGNGSVCPPGVGVRPRTCPMPRGGGQGSICCCVPSVGVGRAGGTGTAVCTSYLPAADNDLLSQCNAQPAELRQGLLPGIWMVC